MTHFPFSTELGNKRPAIIAPVNPAYMLLYSFQLSHLKSHHENMTAAEHSSYKSTTNLRPSSFKSAAGVVLLDPSWIEDGRE
jgi:hypothetical protein